MKSFTRGFVTLAFLLAIITSFFSSAQAGSTPDTATQLTLGTPITDALSQTSRTNYYSFTIASPGLVTVRLTHASNGSDWSYLRAVVQSTDTTTSYLLLDSPGNQTDLAHNVALPAGTYLVKIEPGWAGNDYNNYGLTVTATPGSNYEVEKNDTPETASPIVIGSGYSGGLAPLPYGSDVDYYRFVLASASYVSLNFQHGSNGINETYWNATIRSADGSMEFLLLDSSGTATDTTRIVLLPAGSYLVKIERGWAGIDYGSYGYSVTVNAEPRANLESEKNDDTETADEISLGTWYSGIIAPLQGASDADYYRFTAPASRPLLLNFRHAELGITDRVWNIRVLDAEGQQYLSFDSTGSASDSSYGTAALTAGTRYYIKVTDYYKQSIDNLYQVSVTPDTAPPAASAFPAAGTYNYSTTVTLSCNDGTQSGCDKTYYTTDGSTPTTASTVYTTPISIPTNSSVQVKYFAVDLAGNSSAVRNESYFIDTLDPTTTASPAAGAFKSATNVTLSCSDTGSGCDKIYYTTDGSYPSTSSTLYTGPIAIAATTTLRFFATDLAGNWEDPQSKLVHIDATTPSTAAPPGGTSSTDSITWAVRTSHDEMYDQNGVVSVSGTIMTIGAKIDPYATNVASGFIMSGTDGGAWNEIFDDFVPYCYNSASWGLPCNSALYGVTSPGTPFAVVGAQGHIRTADTAVLYENSGTSNDLYAVTWSSFLSRYVVVGAEGTIVTSADGSNWTVLAVSGQNLRGVASSGTRVVAVGTGGAIFTSTNGAAWSAATSGTTENLHAVTWSPTLLKFVAVGANGTILTSADGVAWVKQNSRVFDPLYGVAASGTQFVAVGDNGAVVASPDGVVWKRQAAGTTSNLRAVTWSGTKFFAVGAGGAWVSGIESAPLPANSQVVTLTCNDGQGSGCDRIYYTTDGSTPTTASTLYTGPFTLYATTTVKFFSVDMAGNSETPKSEIYRFSGPATSITLTGTGGGSVNSNPAGLACVSGTCTTNFPQGITVTLLPTADSNSLFTGWGGACSGSGSCSVVTSTDRNVTATFSRVLPVRLVETPARDFEGIQAAYDAAGATATVLARGLVIVENLVLNRAVALTLKGGYDTRFTSRAGFTAVDGNILLRRGKLIANGLAVK